MDPLVLVLLVVVGGAAGLAAGLFGIGGGIITVPAVLLLTPLDFRQSVAVSLFNILVTTPMGLWHHARAHHVQWRTGVLLGAAGVAGVVAATWLDPFLDEHHLVWGFALFLLYSSQRVAYGTAPLVRLRGPVAFAAAGFASGLAAKLFGVGGGLVLVPTLVFSGLGMHAAVGTSLFAVFTNAALGSAANLVLVPGNWALYAVPVVVGSWIGVQAGSRWGLASRADGLRRAFAVLLALVGLVLVHRGLG